MPNIEDLGAESVLGDSSLLEDAQDGRDRLVLALRYLPNWYKATEGTDLQIAWWRRLDILRDKIERAYKRAITPEEKWFFGKLARDLYDDAARDWPQIWRELTLLVPDPSLLDKAASIITSPLAGLPTIGNELGKIVGATLGNIVRQVWPWLLVGGAVLVVYTFRAPLARAVSKGVA
jgi:hypothetical protein